MTEPFSKPFRVRWSDMAFNAHMRNTAYLDIAANVRMMFFEERGFCMSMRQVPKSLFILALLLLLSLPAAAEYQKIKVAVIDFQLQGKGHETEDMGKIVAEWLITALVREGRFDVIERRMLAKLLEEQKLGQSGVIDADTASRIGKLLGVKVVISGSIQKLQDFTEVNARIISVESASILAAESVKSVSTTRLEELVAQMAGKIIQDFPLEGYIVNRDEKGVLLDLGTTTGARSGMWFMAYREGEAIKHPKTGAVIEVLKIPTGFLRVVHVTDKTARAEILSEAAAHAVAYGQMVKSVPEEAARGAAKEMGKPVKARLTVSAGPPGAVVRLLNSKQSYSPGMTLDAGKYEIEVSLAGYEKDRQTIDLAVGDDKNVKVTLVPLPPSAVAEKPEPPPPAPEIGRLTVSVDPAAAAIRLLNTKLGYSPGVSLPAGKYTLEISAPGYETARKSVTLAANENARLELSLQRKAPPEPPATVVAPATKSEEKRETTTAKAEPSGKGIADTPSTQPQAKGRLFVTTNPPQARVQMLNSPEPYREGIALSPGEYQLEVSASGYDTYRKKVKIEGRDISMEIVMTPTPPPPRPPEAPPRETPSLAKSTTPPEPSLPATGSAPEPRMRRHPVRVGIFPWNLKGDAVGFQARLVNAIGSLLSASTDFKLIYCALDSSLPGVRQPRDGGPKMSALDGIWKKSHFLATPALDPEMTARLGRELDLDAVIVGTLGLTTRYADQYALQGVDVSMVDVPTGRLVSTGNAPPLSTVEDAVSAMISECLKNYRALMRGP